MRKLILFLGLLFCFNLLSAQTWKWIPDGNGNLMNPNPDGVGIGVNGVNWTKLYIYDNITAPFQIPQQGRLGLFSYINTSYSGNSTGKIWGGYLLSLNTGTGSLNESIGLNATSGVESSSNGTVNNAYGIYSKVQNGNGIVNNGYGIYIKDVEATNQYAIYQEGTNDTNYFSGNTGIGITNPQYKLDVAGTINATNILNNGQELAYQVWTRDGQTISYEENSGQIYSILKSGNNFLGTGLSDATQNATSLIFNENGAFSIGKAADISENSISNYSEILRITNQGYIGVGNENPAYEFDVQGTINATNILVDGNELAYQVWEEEGPNISYEKNSGSTYSVLKSGTNFLGTGLSDLSQDGASIVFNENSQLRIAKATGITEAGATNYTELLRITESGMVGIGTSNPAYKLDVQGTINASSIFLDGSPLVTTLWTESGQNLSYNGSVGIGTTDPGNWKLAVNGHIRAKEIKVETAWSDFVFEDTYTLPTLEEVEQHIKEKGHLQDIPSAKEVEQNGIFLGEMDSKLLQKIEELTLYAIEQEKQLKEQKNEQESQQKKITDQEKKIIELENKINQLLNAIEK